MPRPEVLDGVIVGAVIVIVTLVVIGLFSAALG